jgi:hypothetical protein
MVAASNNDSATTSAVWRTPEVSVTVILHVFNGTDGEGSTFACFFATEFRAWAAWISKPPGVARLRKTALESEKRATHI